MLFSKVIRFSYKIIPNYRIVLQKNKRLHFHNWTKIIRDTDILKVLSSMGLFFFREILALARPVCKRKMLRSLLSYRS